MRRRRKFARGAAARGAHHRALPSFLPPKIQSHIVQPKKVATCWCHAATGGTFSPRYSPVPAAAARRAHVADAARAQQPKGPT